MCKASAIAAEWRVEARTPAIFGWTHFPASIDRSGLTRRQNLLDLAAFDAYVNALAWHAQIASLAQEVRA
jgi:hypothetical protein